MRRFIITASLVAFAAGLAVSGAQQSGTLVLRSGETLTGELVDLGGVGFTFRVNGQDREIARNDVVSIDFGGGSLDVPAEARSLEAGASLAILRSGELVQGQFYDVSGTRPLRIVFRTNSGERELASTDVRRIYVTRPDDALVGSTGTPGSDQGRTVVVSGRSGWTNTGINVTSGQRLRFESSGEIVFSPRGHVARPAGSVDNLFDSNAPLPNALQGALIARIGPGTAARGRGASSGAFVIGDQTTVVMPSGGALFLGVNDSGLSDNRGEFTVRIFQ